jgi:tight adherence protein C
VLIIGAILVFAAIALLVLALAPQKSTILESRMASLRGEGSAVIYKPTQGESIMVRVLGPMGSSLGRRVGSLLPGSLVKAVEQRLIQAGEPVTTGGFLGAVALLEAVMLGMGFLVAMSLGGLQGNGLMALGACGVMGFFLPRVWLESRVRTRQHDILRSLPDAFDLITTCVEAGLGLDASLAKVAEKVEGPFAEELTVMTHEVSLGKLRRDALKDLADRIGIPDLSIFVNAIIQAESMGTSVAGVLRVQADQMRVRRRQRAEQQAYKAPVKMVFPLVLCIFPTLFLVILGPAGITLYQTIIKGNIGK